MPQQGGDALIELIMFLLLFGAIYFGAMAHIAKYSWFDIKKTTQFTVMAVASTVAFIILALVFL